ncbi:MAG: glycoside hydrolase family 31 protein [Ruminococcaceae bacterium]|nr:glycoside hydrolase family 31 protein [Oscillospiraceae bacterium]
MRIRLLSTLLLLAMLLGIFGCSEVIPTAQVSDAVDEHPNFIHREQSLLLNTEDADTDRFINVAATNEEDEPMFQIVYDISADTRVAEQCMTLAANICDVTGVEIPVVHSSEKQADYEITVGEVKRKETLDVIDSFDLEDTDFVICVVDTRILIYAESDQALCSAVIFFMEEAVRKSATEKLYGLYADYVFTYHPNKIPTVTLMENTDPRSVEFALENGPSMYTYVRLSFTGNEGWRIQTKYSKSGKFRDTGASQLLAYSLGEHTLGTEDERFYLEEVTSLKAGNSLTVTSKSGSRAVIGLSSFRMDFYTKSGSLAASITNISHNAGAGTIVGELEEDEAIFGTGERFNGANQRGKLIEMFTKDIWSRANACYMAIPLLSSSRGSGIFLNNYEHMMLDLDSKKNGTWSAVITGAPIDCYVFTTEKIPEVIYGYSALSGFAGLPEEWSYGMLVCSISPEFSQKWTADIIPDEKDGRNEGVYEMIANMEAYDLPWTGVLAEGWGPYNPEKHNDLKELCDYVHSIGKKFLVYIRVGTANIGVTGYHPSYLLTQTRPDGSTSHSLPDTTANTNNPDVSDATETHVYIDVTNPDVVLWFFEDYWHYLSNEIGVDGAKIDFCETLPENYKLNYFDENIPTAGSHHWYPTAFCARFWDMISQKPDSGMCYTRGGGIGSQRAPYMWAGDQMRYWDGLSYQLSAILSSGLSGVPYMSYDMSGYQYGYDQKLATVHKRVEYESAVFIRGTQFSAYTLCIQTHGRVKRAYQFAKEFPLLDANGNEVKDKDGNTVMKDYTYVTEIYRAYTKLHEHLTPYITELSKEASATGMPVMRHLVLGWQNDKNVYSIEDEYVLGDAFLIAPILTEGTSRSVYLPKGTWEDLNTGTVHEVSAAGLWIDVNASLAELPSFFNTETESETARELIDGIKEIYSYAKSLEPKA